MSIPFMVQQHPFVLSNNRKWEAYSISTLLSLHIRPIQTNTHLQLLFIIMAKLTSKPNRTKPYHTKPSQAQPFKARHESFILLFSLEKCKRWRGDYKLQLLECFLLWTTTSTTSATRNRFCYKVLCQKGIQTLTFGLGSFNRILMSVLPFVHPSVRLSVCMAAGKSLLGDRITVTRPKLNNLEKDPNKMSMASTMKLISRLLVMQ